MSRLVQLLLCGSVAPVLRSAALSLVEGCSADAGRCPRTAGGEHLLLQLDRAGQLITGPAVTGEHGCKGMPDIKKRCSSDSCKVLANGMKHHSCRDFCRRSGRRCVAAWEDESDGCTAKKSLDCDETFGETSDLLCQCAPEVVGLAAIDSGRVLSEDSCQGMPDVKKSCSDDGCRVLADQMKDSSCREYCARTGRSCSAAFEEIDNTCGIEEDRSCDTKYSDTSDLLCQCRLRSGSTDNDMPGDSTWELLWADEFDGRHVDRKKWHLEHAGGGFGNRELQYYREQNAHVKDGRLILTAKCQSYRDHRFTSAKLMTKHKAQWGPGHRIEVRAKVPIGRGTWPAIWMLPAKKAYGGWPKSGEIDIMEAVGCSPKEAHGTVHTGSYNHMRNSQAYGSVPTVLTEWHTYTLDWTTDGLEWSIDGQIYAAFAPNDRDSGKWPFDQEFYLILNLAVGGSWGGSCLGNGRPSCSSPQEFGRDQEMEVDYARVYRQT